MTSRSCEPPVIRPKAQAPRRSDREANRILPTDEQNKLKESVEKKPCYWGKKRIILERPALKSRSRKREWVWVRPGGKEKGKPASDAPPVCNRHRRSSPACWIRSEEHKRYAPKCVRDDSRHPVASIDRCWDSLVQSRLAGRFLRGESDSHHPQATCRSLRRVTPDLSLG